MRRNQAQVHPTWEILNLTDPSEWLALTADQKQIYQLLISAGTVATADGLVRDLILGMFPEGTVTGDAFREAFPPIPPPV